MPLFHPQAATAPPPAQATSAEPQVPQFADCGRAAYSLEHRDWLVLASDPNVAVCPSCFNTTIAPYPDHARYFIRNNPGQFPGGIACDMTRWWMRLAWLSIVAPGAVHAARNHDVGLLSRIGGVMEETCPNGEVLEGLKVDKEVVVRQWFCFKGGDGQLLEEFTVCSFCVRKIHLLLPAVEQQGLFAVAVGGQAVPGSCDIIRESLRAQNFLFMLGFAVEGPKAGRADISQVEAFIRKYGPLGECPGPTAMSKGKCHRSGKLNDFDVCETCYEDLVKPYVGSQLATFFPVTASKSTNGFTCDLGSKLTRDFWMSCVPTDDANAFAQRMAERARRRDEIVPQLQMLDNQIQLCQASHAMYLQGAMNETRAAGSQLLADSIGSYHRYDYRYHNPYQNNSNAYNMQAFQESQKLHELECQKEVLLNDWRTKWE